MHAQDRIDAAARAAGRNPADVRRVIQLVGAVTGTPYITGIPDDWAKIIAEFAAEERFDTINLIPEEQAPELLRLFATEVMPPADAATAA